MHQPTIYISYANPLPVDEFTKIGGGRGRRMKASTAHERVRAHYAQYGISEYHMVDAEVDRGLVTETFIARRANGIIDSVMVRYAAVAGETVRWLFAWEAAPFTGSLQLNGICAKVEGDIFSYVPRRVMTSSVGIMMTCAGAVNGDVAITENSTYRLGITRKDAHQFGIQGFLMPEVA